MSELQNLLSSSSSSQQYQAVLSSSPPSFHTSNDTLIAKPLPSSMDDRVGGDQHQLVRRDSITRQSSSRTTKCRCQEQGRRKPWVERLGDLIHRFSASVELENTGSVARDHLGKECICYTVYLFSISNSPQPYISCKQTNAHSLLGCVRVFRPFRSA